MPEARTVSELLEYAPCFLRSGGGWYWLDDWRVSFWHRRQFPKPHRFPNRSLSNPLRPSCPMPLPPHPSRTSLRAVHRIPLPRPKPPSAIRTDPRLIFTHPVSPQVPAPSSLCSPEALVASSFHSPPAPPLGSPSQILHLRPWPPGYPQTIQQMPFLPRLSPSPSPPLRRLLILRLPCAGIATIPLIRRPSSPPNPANRTHSLSRLRRYSILHLPSPCQGTNASTVGQLALLAAISTVPRQFTKPQRYHSPRQLSSPFLLQWWRTIARPFARYPALFTAATVKGKPPFSFSLYIYSKRAPFTVPYENTAGLRPSDRATGHRPPAPFRLSAIIKFPLQRLPAAIFRFQPPSGQRKRAGNFSPARESSSDPRDRRSSPPRPQSMRPSRPLPSLAPPQPRPGASRTPP